MSTVLARVTVTASAAKAPVANKTTTKTVAPQQRASIGARAVAFAKTNVPAAVALVNAVAASRRTPRRVNCSISISPCPSSPPSSSC